MKLLFTSSQGYDEACFKQIAQEFSDLDIKIDYCSERLTEKTAPMVSGYDAVISFVNDQLDENCLNQLAKNNLKVIFLRSAGYNHVNLKTAKMNGIDIFRVPAYSPEAVAEHTLALLMTLNRKTHKAYNRVREMNFSLNGLSGFNLKNKTIGIIGTGKIGGQFAKIMSIFECKILMYDVEENRDLLKLKNAHYVTKEEILKKSDIISFHCPLNSDTKYFINRQNLNSLKKGVILLNTGRGALIETSALIQGLKNKLISGAALDVYEFESELFFTDHSEDIIQDDTISRLMSFPNVLITAHQGFLTEEALVEIAKTTFTNIKEYLKNSKNSVSTNKISFDN